MKSSNSSGLHKFLSVVLIAVLLVFVVGFASNGWQEDQGNPDNGEDGGKTDDTDENTDGTNEENKDNTNDDNTGDDKKEPSDDDGDENKGDDENKDNLTPPDDENGENQEENKEDNKEDTPPPEEILPPPPVYINVMTGLEVSEEQMTRVPLGFVFDPAAPLYGISSSELAIEFPTEDGTTRLLSYTTDNSALWKIGSLVETRAFISAMSYFFGGIVVSYGNDDVIPYDIFDTSAFEFDLSKNQGSYHRENAKYVYTSYEKLMSSLETARGMEAEAYKNAPFDFAQEGVITGVSSATTVVLPYSEKYESSFYYSEKSGKYLYYKGGNRKVDMLSGKNVSFDNVFVLFADATTYEKASGTELVMDVMSGGRGYYATKGTLTEFTWALNELGELNFYSLSGERLTVNTGNSYVAFYKASEASSVKIS